MELYKLKGQELIIIMCGKDGGSGDFWGYANSVASQENYHVGGGGRRHFREYYIVGMGFVAIALVIVLSSPGA